MSNSHTRYKARERMTEKVPVARPEQTLAEIRDMLQKEGGRFETIHYIYVLDPGRKLTGILCIKDLLCLPGEARIGDVCTKEHLIMVKGTANQERAAYKALKHGIKAVPVVTEDHVFLGVIPSDTILEILYHELQEDTMRLAGIRHARANIHTILDLPLSSALKHRIPWLFLGLLGGLFSASVIGLFEETLREHIILATFIPLIVYMSDAVRTQMEAYLIRDLALDRDLPFERYILRQLLITIVIAIVFGALLAAAATLLGHETGIVTVLGVALFAAITSSLSTGLIIPYCFSRIHLDPADASGPIGTIIQDLMSVAIYLVIASSML